MSKMSKMHTVSVTLGYVDCQAKKSAVNTVSMSSSVPRNEKVRPELKTTSAPTLELTNVGGCSRTKKWMAELVLTIDERREVPSSSISSARATTLVPFPANSTATTVTTKSHFHSYSYSLRFGPSDRPSSFAAMQFGI